MANQFGNYLCQKIIEVASKRDLSLIVHSILPKATSISMSVHGTRAMQTLVEVLADKIPGMETECNMLVKELECNILNLSTHVNGNHVIQAFLTSFKSSDQPQDSDMDGAEMRWAYTQFIFDACMNYCQEIGTHKHGCCVMQRCLEKGSKLQKMELADVIIDHLSELI